MLRLALRRTRRKRWWPGRRFFMFYPALLGAALGYGVIVALSRSEQVLLAALVTGVPAVCLMGVFTGLLAFVLPWIVPALTAASIARERELGTLDLLRTTLLTERAIVWGKLGGCLVQLWPGILTLALLAPFQLLWVGSASWSFYLPAMLMGPLSDTAWSWGWLILVGVAGLLRPWGDLALHAAVGLLVSARARSSGVAVFIAYSAILVVRVSLWLARSLLSSVLMAPAQMALGMVLVEFAGAALSLWGAIWWMKRT